MNAFVTLPVLFLIFAFAGILTIGFSRGKKENKRIFLSAFNDLVDVIKPDDQTFTNIGGLVGYHANLSFKGKSPVSEIDATITLLPRHAWLYMPISKLITKYDKLFITLYMRHDPPGEGHLIESKYSCLRGSEITNAHRLYREEIKWGEYNFYMYYEMAKMHEFLLEFINNNLGPGIIRHIAIIPKQRKGFIFMIPQKGQVAKYLAPTYQLIISIFES
jgi:hypothetical protein